MTFWAEKSIFPEQLRQSTADLDQIQYTWTCPGVTTFRELRAQLAHFGQNGVGTSPRAAQVFLCGKPCDLLATLQRPIFTKFGHET